MTTANIKKIIALNVADKLMQQAENIIGQARWALSAGDTPQAMRDAADACAIARRGIQNQIDKLNDEEAGR